jgi:hypothetical protein
MSPLIQQEALEVLTAELDGHTGRIPPSLAAAQLLRATEGGDFALQKAAADALLRRIRAVATSGGSPTAAAVPTHGRAHTESSWRAEGAIRSGSDPSVSCRAVARALIALRTRDLPRLGEARAGGPAPNLSASPLDSTVAFAPCAGQRWATDRRVPEEVNEPLQPWRSRLVDDRWQVNTGHPDYRALAAEARPRLRYLATLLSKEVVSRSFPQPGIGATLEELVGLLAALERSGGWRGRARDEEEPHRPAITLRESDSNRRPPGYEPGDLPT